MKSGKDIDGRCSFALMGAYRKKTELMPKRVMRLERKRQRISSAPSKQA